MGKFYQILTELSVQDTPVFWFSDDSLSKCQRILTKLVRTLILRRSGLGLLMGKFCHFLTVFSAWDMIMAGYYLFYIFIFAQKHTL